jgi:transcriptional regulator with XRE-family HTH domain
MRQRQELGTDLREARLAAGLRQRDVGKALGWSHSRVGRIERGQSERVTFDDLALVAACVGLSFNGRFFPGPSRDYRAILSANFNPLNGRLDHRTFAAANLMPD